MKPPTLTLADLTPESVDEALRSTGGFLLAGTEPAVRALALVAEARAFFALPRSAKQAVAIERSPHFRGWSELHNERDWREQIHFGREQRHHDRGAAHDALGGPNLWPEAASFRAAVLDYMDAAAALGDALLRRIAAVLTLPDAAFGTPSHDGYRLLKLIAYHPQPALEVADEKPRSGVAAHVDFSWLTLTWQDHPGLEVRAPDGTWLLIPPQPDTLWIHSGEILQHATRGRYPATPHRVTNRSEQATRVSIPFFVNPSLEETVPVSAGALPPVAQIQVAASEHVHRVLVPGAHSAPLHFGAAEWQRKGQNLWCAECTEPIAAPLS